MYDVFFTTIKLSVCRTNGLSVQVGKLAQVWLLSRFACALALAGLRVCGHEQASTRLTLRADLEHTVRHLGMETGISEASKKVSIFPFATQGGKQVSSYFRQRNWVQARVPCRLT